MRIWVDVQEAWGFGRQVREEPVHVPLERGKPISNVVDKAAGCRALAFNCTRVVFRLLSLKSSLSCDLVALISLNALTRLRNQHRGSL